MGQKETIVLVQTDKNSVFGGYFPDQLEDTTGKKSSNDILGWKDIVSGNPFLFYWVNDQIQIIKHRDNKIPVIKSDKDWLLEFVGGFEINAHKNEKSRAGANFSYFLFPLDHKNLPSDDGRFCFAGGKDKYFKALDVEVWGLN